MNENKKTNLLFIIICIFIPIVMGYLLTEKINPVQADYNGTTIQTPTVYLNTDTGSIEGGIESTGTGKASNVIVTTSEDRLTTERNDKGNIEVPKINKGKNKPNKQVKVSAPKTVKSPTKVRLTGFPEDSIAQEYANYAYKIGGENLLLLILCENGGLDLSLQSRVINSKGFRETSYGLCQMRLPRADIDTNRFLSDYKYQLDKCREKRKSGTAFYGPTRIIKGMACHIYAKKYLVEFIK